jgi:hypothetical protein
MAGRAGAGRSARFRVLSHRMNEPPKRRWFQFRLRTLLLIVAIVAVQCTVCVPMLREWRERQQREELERLIDSAYVGNTVTQFGFGHGSQSRALQPPLNRPPALSCAAIMR